MKFGNRLLSEMNQEIGLINYVSYVTMKQKMKALELGRQNVEKPADTPEVEDLFALLYSDIEKVSVYYREKLAPLRESVESKSVENVEGLYCEIKALMEYCVLNLEAVEKMHKKFHKYSRGRDHSLVKMDAILQASLDCDLNSGELEKLKQQAIELFMSQTEHAHVHSATKVLEDCWDNDERSVRRITEYQQAAFFTDTTVKQNETGEACKVLGGTFNEQLAKDVCAVLQMPMEPTRVGTFSNGEIDIKLANNVRGDDVYVVLSTCGTRETPQSINKAVMELLLLVHTLRLASAKRITAVVPYLAYSRQDRKTEARVPISASALAQMLLAMGMDKMICVDLHCGQIQGFFGNAPVDNLQAHKEFVKHLQKRMKKHNEDMSNVCVVSPDAGGVERARILADSIGANQVVTILKRRVQANQVDSMQIVGDVAGMTCIIVDDIIDTAGTLVKAARLLESSGAKKVIACATHGILTDPACERINNCKILTEVVVTDSVPQQEHLTSCPKLKVLTLAALIAEAIYRTHNEISVSDLFLKQKPQGL